MLENSKPTIFRKHISKRTDTYKTITKNEELVETFHSFFSRMVDNTKIGYDIETLENIFILSKPCPSGNRNIEISSNYIKN